MVFISSRIWKGHKWVSRSKILSGFNLNMVYWDPVQKQENFIGGSQEQKRWIQNIKVPFGIRHPHLHIKPSLYVCRRVQGSKIFQQNLIISIYSRVIVILLIWVSLALGVWQVGRGYLGWTTIVYMSPGVFRGKESSNRIELSRLVQDLLNFVVLGSLQLWGGGRWVGGCLGTSGGMAGVPTDMHMHVHAHTHAHTCIEIANGHWH